jgi:hypothetical protein
MGFCVGQGLPQRCVHPEDILSGAAEHCQKMDDADPHVEGRLEPVFYQIRRPI